MSLPLPDASKLRQTEPLLKALSAASTAKSTSALFSRNKILRIRKL